MWCQSCLVLSDLLIMKKKEMDVIGKLLLCTHDCKNDKETSQWNTHGNEIHMVIVVCNNK